MTYVKRYAGGYHDLPLTDTPVDSTALNDIQNALVTLFGVAPLTNGAMVWDGSVFRADAKIKDAQVDSAAAIAYSKLALASSIVNADIAAAAAIGYRKTQGRPAIQVNISAPQPVGSAAAATIVMNTVVSLIDGNVIFSLNTGTGKITVSETGFYLITAYLTMSGVAGTAKLAIPLVNGSEVGRGFQTPSLNNVSVALATPLTSGQTVEVQAYQDSGANSNVSGSLSVVQLSK